MCKTKLIIIRHGESIGNLKQHFLGQTDWDLSEQGYNQAKITANFLKDEKIDVVYSSDLIRAYNTVLPIAKTRGLEVIKNKNLREIYAGEWEAKSYDELCESYSEPYTIWKTDIGNAACTGGESVLDVQKRVHDEILAIAKNNIGKTVCIGTHATPIRTLFAAIKNIDKDLMHNIKWASNASITIVEYENGELIVKEYSKDDFMGDNVTVFSKNI